MSDLLDKISELEQQLVELRAEAEKGEKENKGASKRWRANRGGDYWYVSDYGITIQEEDSRSANSTLDNYHYDTHNYFQTEKEARKYASVLETERQLKKFADDHNDKIDWEDTNQEKWSLYYNYEANRTSVTSALATKDARVIYFSSDEIIQQAIDTIGIEEIKEYLTYEW